MKELIDLREKLTLIEAEIRVLSEKFLELNDRIKKYEEQELEIKAIKLFLKRVFPDFQKEYPKILKKLSKKE